MAQDVETDWEFPKYGGPNNFVRSLAVELDGSLLVGGAFSAIGGVERASFARIKPNGEVDVDFAPQLLNGYPASLQVLEDGRILISGSFDRVNGTNCPGLAVLKANGELDPGFRPPAVPSQVSLKGMAASDGSVWVTGSFTNLGGSGNDLLARLLSDGSIDPGFHSPFQIGETAVILAVQQDGKAIVYRSPQSPGIVPLDRLVRLHTNGDFDSSYQTGLAENERISRAVLQADGRLVASVYTTASQEFDYPASAPRLVRFKTDGSSDKGFNLATESPGFLFNSGIIALFAQPDNKIVVIGTFLKIGGVARGKVARILADGSVDPCFDVPFATEWAPLAIAVAPDGSYLVGGSFDRIAGHNHDHLVRIISKPCEPGTIQMALPNIRVGGDGARVLIPVVRRGGMDLSQSASFVAPNACPSYGVINFSRGERSKTIELTTGPGEYEVWLSQAIGGAMLGAQTNTHVSLAIPPGPGSSGMVDSNFVVSLDGPVFAVEVMPDSRIVIQGGFTNVNGERCPGIARLNEDGTRDKSFNRQQAAPSDVENLRVDAFGRVLLAGHFQSVDGVFVPGLARLKEDGSLDQSFVPLAAWETNSYGTAEARAVAITEDSRVVCSASLPLSDGDYLERLLRFSDSGLLDPEYGNDLPHAYAANLLPAGSGYLYFMGQGLGSCVARLSPEGLQDFSFLPPNDCQGWLYTASSELLPDGRVVVAVNPSAFSGLLSTPRLQRHNPDGSSDVGFVLRSLGAKGPLDFVDAFCAEPDGAVVLFGYHKNSQDRSLVRYLSDGAPDWGFDAGKGPASPSAVRTIKPFRGGWLVGGEFSGWDGHPQKHLVKLLPRQLSRPLAFTINFTNVVLRETNLTLAVDVRRTGDASTQTSVTLRTIDCSAVGGQDYVSVQTNLVFRPGEWLKTVPLTLMNDSVVEPTESFSVVLTNASSPYAIGQPGAITVTIENDDVSVEFSHPVYEAVEEDGYASVTVKWSGLAKAGLTAEMRVIAVMGSGDDIDDASLSLTRKGTTNWVHLALRDNAIKDDTRVFRLELASMADVSVGRQNIAFLVVSDRDFATAPARGVAGIVNAVVNSATGGVYVVGDFSGVHGQPRRNVARLLPDGEVDLRFDPGIGPDGIVFAAASQPDDKLVIAGSFTNCGGIALAGVARLNSDGSVDTTFNPGQGAAATSSTALITHVKLASNGGILVGGNFAYFDGRYSPSLALLDDSGRVNAAFDSPFRTQIWSSPPPWPINGRVILHFIHVAPNGNILAGGSFSAGSSSGVVVRLLPNGHLDKVLSSRGAACAAFTSDQHILVGFSASRTQVPAMDRMDFDGVVDFGFQVRNVPAIPDYRYVCRELLPQPDGRIVCSVLLYPMYIPAPFYSERAMVFRLMEDGQFDPTFTPLLCEMPMLGVPGSFWYNQFRSLYEIPPVNGVALAQQPDGVLVIGGAFDSINGEPRRRLARAETNGFLRGQLKLHMVGEGGIRLLLPFEAEAPYMIETSSNLIEWRAWHTNEYPWLGGELMVAPNESSRFFRAKPTP